MNDVRDSAHLAIREVISQCGATITKTIFEIICMWQTNFKFVLRVPQIVPQYFVQKILMLNSDTSWVVRLSITVTIVLLSTMTVQYVSSTSNHFFC